MIDVVRAAWLIARKDFTIEARSREIIATAAFFAVACVLVFSFSLVTDGRAPDGAGSTGGTASSGTIGESLTSSSGAGEQGGCPGRPPPALAGPASSSWSACRTRAEASRR